MRVQDLAKSRKDLYMIDPADLHEEPGWNVRNDTDDLKMHIRTLADSIKEIGVKESLTCYVQGEKLIVTNGHCRLEAVMLAISEGADIKTVPVRIEDKHDNEADRTLSLITRNEGLPLSPIEKAAVVKRLLGYGWNRQEITKKAGFSGSYFSFLCSLSALDPSIQAQIARGEISADSALKAVQSMGPELGKAAIGDVVDKAKSKGKTKATPRDFVKPAVVELSEELGIPADCLNERKGVFSIIIRDLGKESVADVVNAVREAGLDIV